VSPSILPTRRTFALVLPLVEPLHIFRHVSVRRLQRLSTSLLSLPLSLSCGCSFFPAHLSSHSHSTPNAHSSLSLFLSLALSLVRARGFQCRVRQQKAPRVAVSLCIIFPSPGKALTCQRCPFGGGVGGGGCRCLFLYLSRVHVGVSMCKKWGQQKCRGRQGAACLYITYQSPGATRIFRRC
jgi:hypothetical protein